MWSELWQSPPLHLSDLLLFLIRMFDECGDESFDLMHVFFCMSRIGNELVDRLQLTLQFLTNAVRTAEVGKQRCKSSGVTYASHFASSLLPDALPCTAQRWQLHWGSRRSDRRTDTQSALPSRCEPQALTVDELIIRDHAVIKLLWNEYLTAGDSEAKMKKLYALIYVSHQRF